MKWLVAAKHHQLALAMATSILFYSVMSFAAWSYHSAGLAEQAEKLTQLDRLRAVAAYGPKLETPSGNEIDPAFAGSFLPDGPPAVVSANLLDLVKQMAAMQGIEVLQAESLPPKPMEGLTLVGGKLQMVGQAPAVMNFLKAVENAEPVLVTERLSLRNIRSGADEVAIETSLSIELQIFGALRGLPPASTSDGG